jgi:hypothetical protein
MNRGRPCAASADNPARRRAIALVSGIVGGVAIARALDKIDPKLSKTVLVFTQKDLEHLCRLVRS